MHVIAIEPQKLANAYRLIALDTLDLDGKCSAAARRFYVLMLKGHHRVCHGKLYNNAHDRLPPARGISGAILNAQGA